MAGVNALGLKKYEGPTARTTGPIRIERPDRTAARMILKEIQKGNRVVLTPADQGAGAVMRPVHGFVDGPFALELAARSIALRKVNVEVAREDEEGSSFGGPYYYYDLRCFVQARYDLALGHGSALFLSPVDFMLILQQGGRRFFTGDVCPISWTALQTDLEKHPRETVSNFMSGRSENKVVDAIDETAKWVADICRGGREGLFDRAVLGLWEIIDERANSGSVVLLASSYHPLKFGAGDALTNDLMDRNYFNAQIYEI